jgi:hypothetical protein
VRPATGHDWTDESAGIGGTDSLCTPPSSGQATVLDCHRYVFATAKVGLTLKHTLFGVWRPNVATGAIWSVYWYLSTLGPSTDAAACVTKATS